MSPSTGTPFGNPAAFQQSITGWLLKVRSSNVTPFPDLRARFAMVLAHHDIATTIKNPLTMKFQDDGGY
jgi:hypothetical protein